MTFFIVYSGGPASVAALKVIDLDKTKIMPLTIKKPKCAKLLLVAKSNYLLSVGISVTRD